MLFLTPSRSQRSERNESNYLSLVANGRKPTREVNGAVEGADVGAFVPFCPAQFNVTHCLHLYCSL